MLLTEYEAKQLLTQAGLEIPQAFLIDSAQLEQLRANPSTDPIPEVASLTFPVYLKAQVLHGNRALHDLVLKADSLSDFPRVLNALAAKKDLYEQPVTAILVEEAAEITSSAYLALRYDTRQRQLIALYSPEGGSGMDDRGESLEEQVLSIADMPTHCQFGPDILPILQKLWTVLTENDATLVEINPLAQTADGKVLCLDSKIELEDVAAYRHEEWQLYPERSALGRLPTAREKKAHEVSHSDHRGVAGESFFEFEEGELGVMASGGGASTLAMDALLAAGIKPANYTEYSGNPTREKVAGLAEVVLSIPTLRGLYVVGSNANFTDIYETLSGVIDGFLDSPYVSGWTDSSGKRHPFAILVRRGGPHWQKAFEMIRERLAQPLDQGVVLLALHGPDHPLIETAQEMKEVLEAATQTTISSSKTKDSHA